MNNSTVSHPSCDTLTCAIDFEPIACTLKVEQPLRLPLNLFFYHFNCSEPIYKSQCIKLLDVTAVCNQLNVNALN